MVNYRRILWEVAVICAIIAYASSAPSDNSHNHYDQRQNGSDNIRVHVDGVVVAVFPAETIAETLLSAMPDISDILDIDDFEDFQKPKPPSSLKPPKDPLPPKPEEKPQEVSEQVINPQLEADKPTIVESLPAKSTETPINDISLDSDIVKDKKPLTNEQKKALRLKKIFGSLLVPFVRRNRHH